MVKIGDYILIRDIVIDRQKESAIRSGHNKIAAEWESYRNVRFKVIAVTQKESITIQVDKNRVLQLNKKSYDL